MANNFPKVSIGARIEHLVTSLTGGNKRQFCEKVGIKPPTLTHITGDRGSEPGYKFFQGVAIAFPEVNLTWLVTGDGEPLRLPGSNPELEAAYQAIEEKEMFIDSLVAQLHAERLKNRQAPTRPSYQLPGKFDPVYAGQNLHHDCQLLLELGEGLGAWGRAVA